MVHSHILTESARVLVYLHFSHCARVGHGWILGSPRKAHAVLTGLGLLYASAKGQINPHPGPGPILLYVPVLCSQFWVLSVDPE